MLMPVCLTLRLHLLGKVQVEGDSEIIPTKMSNIHLVSHCEYGGEQEATLFFSMCAEAATGYTGKIKPSPLTCLVMPVPIFSVGDTMSLTYLRDEGPRSLFALTIPATYISVPKQCTLLADSYPEESISLHKEIEEEDLLYPEYDNNLIKNTLRFALRNYLMGLGLAFDRIALYEEERHKDAIIWVEWGEKPSEFFINGIAMNKFMHQGRVLTFDQYMEKSDFGSNFNSLFARMNTAEGHIERVKTKEEK